MIISNLYKQYYLNYVFIKINVLSKKNNLFINRLCLNQTLHQIIFKTNISYPKHTMKKLYIYFLLKYFQQRLRYDFN